MKVGDKITGAGFAAGTEIIEVRKLEKTVVIKAGPEGRTYATKTYKWGVVFLRNDGTLTGRSVWFKTRKTAADFGRSTGPLISYAIARFWK